ncbi:hypothetical protein [Streptomyces sp. NPDC088915]|uniref:hypothetical protein n=1 Tax=Streptomyces sp. NPDC088915 TaxID=3365912 RepID=UPI00382AFBEB
MADFHELRNPTAWNWIGGSPHLGDSFDNVNPFRPQPPLFRVMSPQRPDNQGNNNPFNGNQGQNNHPDRQVIKKTDKPRPNGSGNKDKRA